GSWAVMFARGIGEGMRSERGNLPIRVSSALGDGYPTILRSRSPGLEAGDLLRMVDGQDLQGSTSFGFFDRATRGAREHGSVRVLAERAGERFEVQLALDPHPGWWLAFAVLFAYMAIGISLLLAAPSPHPARLVFVTLWCWAM